MIKNTKNILLQKTSKNEVLPLFSNPFNERIRGFEALSHRNTTRSPGLGCSPASQLLSAYKELMRMP